MLPFHLADTAEQALSALTAQQRAQLNAAISYHALVNPGSELKVTISIGDKSQMPALTDRTTLEGRGLGKTIATVRARSTAVGERHTQAGDRAVQVSIRLGHADATPATTEPPTHFSPQRRIYRFLETRAPVLLDTAREFVWSRRGRVISQPLPRFPDLTRDTEIVTETARWAQAPATPPAGAPRAVLFGLHWLQTGGAERWAIESIRIARDAGFVPIVVTDQNSVHPWITRPELEGCLVISMSFAGHLHAFELDLANALLQNYDIRGIVLHHCQWLYDSLPYFKQHRPDLPVIDSLHIVEYLRGGYPGISVKFDQHIDTHHVISPQLVSWLSEVQGIDAGKIELAPLGALTVGESQQFKVRDPERSFTISYIGRLSRQKRPDLFLALVHRLRKHGLKFHAIMQGDGELREVVNLLLDRYRLRDVIEQRFEDVAVADTLRETDLLVITSINEGLTLTTFEAVAAGVPVLSTDVGSQYTLIDDDMLAPRSARGFLPAATKRITALVSNEAAREQAWQQQRARVQQFAEHPDAHHYFERLFAQWQK